MFLEEDINNIVNRHHWLACYVLGDWHLIDITWSTGYCGIFLPSKNRCNKKDNLNLFSLKIK